MKIDLRTILILAVPLLALLLSYVVFERLGASMAAHLKQALAFGEAVTGAIAATFGLVGALKELEHDDAEKKPVDNGEPKESVHTILEPRYAIRALLIVVGGGLLVGGASAMPDCLTCV